MKTFNRLIATLLLSFAVTAVYGHTREEQQAAEKQTAYTVIANPGEVAARSIRINWHTDLESGDSYCYYTRRTDTGWKR